MYKTIILLTSLTLLIGCSQKELKKNIKSEIVDVRDQNKTIKRDVITTETTEFIPEHIRLSHIEVVPH